MATGKVTKRDKKWQISISMGYVDGKRQRKRWTSKATTKAEAIDEMNDELYILSRQSRTGEAADNDYLLEDLFAQWKEYVKLNQTNPKTITDYFNTVQRAIDHLPNKISVILLTPQLIDKMLISITSTLSNNTANKTLTRLKSVLDYGVSRGLIAKNPITAVKPLPTKRVKHRRALTVEEGKELLKVAPERWARVWRFIMSTGLRKQELIELTWDNVDLEKKLVRVLPTDKWKPKTAAGSRSVSLSEEVIKDLTIIKKTSNSDLVFTTKEGTRLNQYVLRGLRAHMHNAFCSLKGLPYGKKLNKRERERYMSRTENGLSPSSK